eukprot:CAMPEP_0206053310 /NCGR_PEP_ID=MMETSP1466-20131121/35542_1 /ASSEMBLY_ACC=CAM_ASM_001126 /TAXON_ID=44452 /ORGANISM="Pavlova gyrans, Strain CCMP608" /LENGTH=91 /DNA_ID=CAMNT_0053428479 /DNA_START=903 /DNA_END=1179 /DNA_ORIENTATION=+
MSAGILMSVRGMDALRETRIALRSNARALRILSSWATLCEYLAARDMRGCTSSSCEAGALHRGGGGSKPVGWEPSGTGRRALKQLKQAVRV